MLRSKIAAAAFAATSTLTLTGCSAPLIAGGAAGAVTANVAGSGIPISQQMDDFVIKNKINTILLDMHDQLAFKSNISTQVFNGIVLLLGQAPTKAARHEIATRASAINGVRVVYNELTVGPSEGIRSYIDDAWITSKVKGNMVTKVNALKFKVITEQGVVYLMGRVTKAEGKQAANIASQTRGVKKVVKVYDLIPHSAPDITTTS